MGSESGVPVTPKAITRYWSLAPKNKRESGEPFGTIYQRKKLAQ